MKKEKKHCKTEKHKKSIQLSVSLLLRAAPLLLRPLLLFSRIGGFLVLSNRDSTSSCC